MRKQKRVDNLPKSFLIHIFFKENQTWQGEVAYSGWKKPISFCSFLELIQIIEDELDKGIDTDVIKTVIQDNKIKKPKS